MYSLDDDAEPLSLLEIQERYAEEYDELTREEKRTLVHEFASEKKEEKVTHTTARGRIQDVTNIAHNMRQLVRVYTIRPTIFLVHSTVDRPQPSCRHQSLLLHCLHLTWVPYETSILLYIRGLRGLYEDCYSRQMGHS